MKYLISKVTGEEYNKIVSNFEISCGTVDSKFGKCFVAFNDDKICFAAFVDGSYNPVSDLKKIFPGASLVQDDATVIKKVQPIFNGTVDEIKILLKGTEFQSKVWETLATLPKGSTWTYEDLAKAIGNPKAVRAVANAVAKNNISYFVPCHRVVSKTAGIGKYHWGAERKLQILKEEKAI